jgi:hypothetical protein
MRAIVNAIVITATSAARKALVRIWRLKIAMVKNRSKVQRIQNIHRVLRRAQDVVSLPNYGGAEDAE